MSNNQRTLDQQPILMKLLSQNLSHHEIYKMRISEVWTEIQDLQNGSFITIRTCHINWIQRSWDPDLSIVQVELPKPYKQWGARETELLTAKDSVSRTVVQQNTHTHTEMQRGSQIKEFYISLKKKIRQTLLTMQEDCKARSTKAMYYLPAHDLMVCIFKSSTTILIRCVISAASLKIFILPSSMPV